MSNQMKLAYDYLTRARNCLLAENQERHFNEPLENIAAVLTACDGYVTGSGIAVLEIGEVLPHNKELKSSSALNDHWLGCVHAAIKKIEPEAPHFDMAMVGFRIAMPKGVNNARIWDASNRALNLIINNLKGIFFPDDNIEHMAFAVMGCWSDVPMTTVFIGNFWSQRDEIMQLLEPDNRSECTLDYSEEQKPWNVISGTPTSMKKCL